MHAITYFILQILPLHPASLCSCLPYHFSPLSVKKFTWDGAGRFLDIAKLKIVLKRAEEAHQSALDYRVRLVDTIAATKDIYFAISKHCCETETRLRIHGGHVRNFKQFISRSVFTIPLPQS